MRLIGRPGRAVPDRWRRCLALGGLGLLLGAGWWAARGPGPDLIVYGATPQGVMAAVSAARQGERVLLLEPGQGIGGQLTQAWLATLDMSTDGRGVSNAQGLFHEFYRALHHDNSFDVPEAARVLQDLLRGAGVQVRLQTAVRRVTLQSGRIRSLDLQGPGQRQTLPVRQIIDATDTADLAALAGVPFTLGRADTGLDRTQMAATLVFRIRGANLRRLAQLVRQSGGREDGQRSRSLRGLVALTSAYPPSDPRRFFLRGFNAAVQHDGSLLVNALLIYGVDGTSPASVRRAYRDGQGEAARVVRFLHDRFPASFGQATLGGVAPRLYLRESRHLQGTVRLTVDDVFYGRRFQDAVAVNGYALDGQGYLPGQAPYLLGTPGPYEVPFGALLPRGVSNLLVVSQAASFDSMAAFSARVVPLQMTLGEAAGQASTLATWFGLTYQAVDRGWPWTPLLRGLLRLHHSRIHAPAHRGRPCPDRRSPAWPAADALLRAGLMTSPYYYVACLNLSEPEGAVDFLNDLEHGSRLGTPLRPFDDRSLRARLRSDQRLTVGLARTLLAGLGWTQWPAALSAAAAEDRVLTRGEAAQVRWTLVQEQRGQVNPAKGAGRQSPGDRGG